MALAAFSRAHQPKKDAPVTLSHLSMEVTALQTIRNLDLTAKQLKTLRQWAKYTVPKAELRKESKGSDKFRGALEEVHRALLANSDEKRIDELTDKLEAIREQEKPQLDDEVEITEEARKRAPEAVRLLGASQVAVYLAVLEEIDDPREHLMEAITKVRDLSAEKWKELRSDIAATIGRLSAGLDSEKADRIGDEAVQLLIVVRSLSEAEFKTQKPELEKKAQKLFGEIGPFDVLRHIMEYTLAELLSNPRLAQAIDAQLKQEPVKKGGEER
jgi:hypothetical protein